MLIQEKTIWTPDNSFLLEYHARIECGEMLVGQELWQELQNLKEDFQNDAFYYDTKEALLRIDFMERCVRLTKSPYYNKPMILMLWQKAFIEAVYSFKMRETTFDRFKKVLLLIARKNTKSETCSALGLSELIVGNDGADIVCSSNDDNQASITYDAIDTMRRLIDPDDLDTKRNQRFILNKTNGSKIFKLSDRTRNKEGRNIDFAILDEIHEMQENIIAKSIEQSQSLKDNPKLILITTEGFVVDGYLDGELKKARAIINGEDDSQSGMRFLPWLYTQDSENEIWQNPKTWVKSNPTLGIVKKWDYLQEQVEIARKSKADRIFVLSKDFNIKQNSVEMWLNLEDYTYKAVYDLEDFRGCVCLGAVDLSETTDLTCAKILMMKPDDNTKYIHTMYFIPERKLEDSDDWYAGARYKEWAKEGLLTITEGNDLDLSVVADWFYKLYKEYDIKLWKCGYDQRFSKDWITRMDSYGWTKENEDLILILQNAQTLSNALKLCEADLKKQVINYNENKIDRWCFKNAGIKVDDRSQCLCVKTEKAKRIDGAVTLIILYETYRRYRTEYKQIVG
jgi:phage terminase large subunit-like protein